MISVIVINYYSARLTEKAVCSVLKDTGDYEIFVVDNTGTPEERKALESLLKTLDVTIIVNDSNVGFAQACNQAFALTKGEFVFLLNPDVFVTPSCLGTLVNFLNGNPDAGSVSPQVYWDDALTYYFPKYPCPSPYQDLLAKLSSSFHAFGTAYSHYERKENLSLWRSAAPVRVKNLSGGVALLRRSAIEQSGGLFDDRFFMFYEDSDLFLRMRNNGFNLYIVPAAKAVHSHHYSNEKMVQMSQTAPLFYEKHYRDSLLRKVAALIPARYKSRRHPSMGSWSAPLSLPIPDKLVEGYLHEWSPNVLFVPSVGYFGKGKTFVFSEQVWNFIDRGEYYSRLSHPSQMISNCKVVRWRKE